MGAESSPIPDKMIGVAVIWNEEGLVLIDKRKAQGLLGGLWEFPGGKVEPGETVEACIQREIKEELGLEIEVRDRVITISHAYTHFDVTV
jgi:A/G-specific adenine glycosylase